MEKDEDKVHDATQKKKKGDKLCTKTMNVERGR